MSHDQLPGAPDDAALLDSVEEHYALPAELLDALEQQTSADLATLAAIDRATEVPGDHR